MQKPSTYLLGILVWCSCLLIILLDLSCEKKKITPPILGPASGSGPIGGGDTQRVTILNENTTLYLPKNEASTLDVVALIENTIGQPMPDGTPVYWSVEDSDASITTSNNGSAMFTWNIDATFDGCAEITAMSGDASDSVQICIVRVKATPTPPPVPTATPGPAPTATPARTLEILNPMPPTYIHACPTGNETLDIIALVRNGGVPENGTPVTFAVYGSTTALLPLPTTPINTNSAGIATYSFINCTTPPPLTTETVTIVVSTGGISASIVITVTP